MPLARFPLLLAILFSAACLVGCSGPADDGGNQNGGNQNGANGTGTTDGGEELGTSDRPIRMYFVPSQEAAKVVASAGEIEKALEKATGLKFTSDVPPNYVAVVTELGTGRGDLAWLPTFAYVFANQKYGVDVALTTQRHGDTEYYGQVLVAADSGMKELSELSGKDIAFTDQLSTAGYIYPSALFAKNEVKPGKTTFTGGHTQAVLALYNGQVDAACTFWSPPTPDGKVGDARKLVLDKMPDVTEKLVILAKTDPIPNDTVAFRKDFPAELREKIVEALLEYAATEDGQARLSELYSITGLERSEDSRYDVVREAVKALGKDAEDFLK